MFKLQSKITPYLWYDSQDGDGARVARVTQAMLKMHKLDIAALQRAYDGH